MRLPPKDDPHGDREGALPLSIVLAVLRENDVEVRHLGGDLYLFASGDVVEAQEMTDPVGGLMVRRLARLFGIHVVDFYYDPATGDRRAPAPKRH